MTKKENVPVVTTNDFNGVSLFVGLPMYGGLCNATTTKSLIDLGVLFKQYNIELKFYFLFNESLITRARNYITDEFMRSGCSHMIFIDSDIGFSANSVLDLLYLSIKKIGDFDVYGALYPKKTIAWEKVRLAALRGVGKVNPNELENYVADFVFNPVIIDPNSTGYTVSLNNVFEAGEIGTGFMLIPRYVFEKFDAQFPELRYKPDHNRSEFFDGTREITAYFDTVIDPETKRYLSEDYYFCKKIRSIGLKVGVAPWIELTHTGSYVFTGSLSKMASLGAAISSFKEDSFNEVKKREQEAKKLNKKIKVRRF